MTMHLLHTNTQRYQAVIIQRDKICGHAGTNHTPVSLGDSHYVVSGNNVELLSHVATSRHQMKHVMLCLYNRLLVCSHSRTVSLCNAQHILGHQIWDCGVRSGPVLRLLIHLIVQEQPSKTQPKFGSSFLLHSLNSGVTLH